MELPPFSRWELRWNPTCQNEDEFIVRVFVSMTAVDKYLPLQNLKSKQIEIQYSVHAIWGEGFSFKYRHDLKQLRLFI